MGGPSPLTLLKAFPKIVRQSDYHISTWLLLGACAQCFLTAFLPRTIAILPPVIALTYRILKGYLIATGRLPNPLEEQITYGRTTAQFPAADGTLTAPKSSESIVVLVLAATYTHPHGRLSPGCPEMGQMFFAMWADAEANRAKYGYLGNTPPMCSEPDKLGQYGRREGDDQGKTMMWLSYWKTLDGLHAFAHADAHMKGWMWWDRGAMQKYKHIGVMHETYEVPAGKWENVFHNFKPFGISHAKFPIKTSEASNTESDEKEDLMWVDGLRSAKGKEWKSMHARMGRDAPVYDKEKMFVGKMWPSETV